MRTGKVSEVVVIILDRVMIPPVLMLAVSAKMVAPAVSLAYRATSRWGKVPTTPPSAVARRVYKEPWRRIDRDTSRSW